MDGEEQVLMRISASPGRRWFGITALAALGGLFLLMAATTPSAGIWAVGFGVAGLAALWAATRMERATRAVLRLTETELSEEGGEVLARIENVVKVDRSVFAMKPSNGFVLLLDTPQGRVWRPGLWWRMGRRVAVGGVTSGGQTRPMADAIAMLIARRKGETPQL